MPTTDKGRTILFQKPTATTDEYLAPFVTKESAGSGCTNRCHPGTVPDRQTPYSSGMTKAGPELNTIEALDQELERVTKP